MVKLEYKISIERFNPDGVGIENGNYFGFPFAPQECELVLISIPWDATASYGKGARFGPDAIIGASTQMDFHDLHNPDGWKQGIATLPVEYKYQEASLLMKDEVGKVVKHLGRGGSIEDDIVRKRVERVNNLSEELNNDVYNTTKRWIEADKIVGVVGGEHSVPFGAIRALAEINDRISVLHIDAHLDLREAYEGFDYSHASIMYNVATKIQGVDNIVSVGARDFARSEIEFAENSDKVEIFTDYHMAERAFKGESWDKVCGEIVAKLRDKVYISFDIDGLSPDNSPSTGTPVPGGLSYNRAVYLLNKVVESGRVIVGFDLCEVAPTSENEWDGNVGARILYKLCNLALLTKANKR